LLEKRNLEGEILLFPLLSRERARVKVKASNEI
jgi:hypothetical protein